MRTVVALVLALVAACGGDPGTAGARSAGPPRDVLLISVDTLRADHLGCYGYGRDTSPHLDALAARGVVFERVTSTASWTLPAHTSLLTGLYPAFHGVEDDGARLPEHVPTLAEGLQAAGYRTLAVVAHAYVSSFFGLARGFDVFDDELLEDGTRNPLAEEVVERFLEHLDREAPERFFAFLHLFDPHWDYVPPAPFDTRFTYPEYDGTVDGTYESLARYIESQEPMPDRDRRQLVACYDGEIAYVDHQLGRLFEELDRRGRLERTLIVVTSDHGEEFREHGFLGHGRTLYGEQLDVPLIVAGHPAFPPGTRRAELVTPIDVAPTLLELVGAPTEGLELQGLSLADPRLSAGRTVFAETVRQGDGQRAARLGSWKAIHYKLGDVVYYYDLEADPREMRFQGEDPSGGELSAALEAYAARADAGWHLEFQTLEVGPVRARGRVHCAGRLVEPRPLFSQRMHDRRADILRWLRSPDGSQVTFEIEFRDQLGAITFATDPPDAPVTLEIELAGEAPGLGLYTADGRPLASGTTLVRGDPRLVALPPGFPGVRPGCYVRAVPDPDAAELSDAAREHLRALGYVDD